MNDHDPNDPAFEADVTAMLQRRANDVDVVAATRLGQAASGTDVRSTRRRQQVLAAAAAGIAGVLGLMAAVSLDSNDDVTSVVSQPELGVDATPTAIETAAALLDSDNPCIPATTANTLALCRTEEVLHTIVAGDRLSQISQTYGVDLDALLRANPNLDPNLLLIGDELVIPPNSAPNSICPEGFSVGQDTTGDGVIDTCYQAASDAPGERATATQDETPPAVWAENQIDGDPPSMLELSVLEVQTNRYAALVNQAEVNLQADCMTGVGLDFVAVDLFAERSVQRAATDFELSPFYWDGGYALPASRGASGSTIGPIANALIAEQTNRVNALSESDRLDYEQALQRCLEQAEASIFDGPLTSAEFYDLVNVGINLQSAARDRVGEHPLAQQQQQAWRQCMTDEGHDVASRSAALQTALNERYGGGQVAAAEPGPKELGLAAADRRCSASLGYQRYQSSALAAAGRHLMAHEPRVIEFVNAWADGVVHLRPKLEKLLGLEVVERLVPSAHVARGIPVDHHFPTKASFEAALVAEAIYCAEQNGVDSDDARSYVDSGQMGWWLNRTIDADRATIAIEGSGLVFSMRRGDSNGEPTDALTKRIFDNGPIEVGQDSELFEFGCAQWASQLVSPKQRAENEPGFNARYASWVEPLAFKEQLESEWALCMTTAGHSFERIADVHQLSFDLMQPLRTNEASFTEALAEDIEVFSDHYECLLTIDFAERFRLFSEETAAQFLAQE